MVHEFVEDLRCTAKNESGKVYAASAINKSVRVYRSDAMPTPGEELISLQEGTFHVSREEDLTEIERMLNLSCITDCSGLGWYEYAGLDLDGKIRC